MMAARRSVTITEVNAEIKEILLFMIDQIDNNLVDFSPMVIEWENFRKRKLGELILHTGIVKDANVLRIATAEEMESLNVLEEQPCTFR